MSKPHVEEVEESFSFGVKRFYAPFIVHANCPSCGRQIERDLTSSYLSYPGVGSFDLEMYCYDEDGEETECAEFTVSLTLGLTLTVDEAEHE